MSGALIPLPPGRQREIAAQEALADLAPLLEQLREAMPLINDETHRARLDRMRGFVGTAALVLDRPAGGIDQTLIDDIANLLGNLRQLRLPARDPDLGFTLGLREVNGAQGQIAMVLMATLAAAAEMGLHPSAVDVGRVDATAVPRALLAGQVAALESRLDDLGAELDRLQAANAPIQIGLVNFYVSEMKIKVDLALLSLRIGDTTIDLSSLIRVAEAIVRLTVDFVETLVGWGQRVAATIREASDRLRRPVRRVAGGVRTAVRWVGHQLARARRRSAPVAPPSEHKPPPAVPPPDFNMEAVKALILAGKNVPAAWVPFVTELDFSRSGLTDATPLAGLTALQSLDLGGTRVTDATPLAGLTALQSLDLERTKVSDATPLAGLTALQSLYLGGTRVSDATPLAGLTALERLDLTGTDVTDVSALRHLKVRIIGGPRE